MVEQKQWQVIHNSIPMPAEMDYRISQAIEKGTRVMHKRKIGRRIGGVVFGVIIILSALIATVNLSPAFAEQLTKIPGGQKLIQLVLLNAEPSQGGDITDGGSVGPIDHHHDDKQESLVISLSGQNDSTYSHYEAKYRDYPYSIELTLNGIRHWTPVQETYPDDGQTALRSIHSLMTLDDATCRVLLVFNRPVNVQIEEDRSQMTLTLVFEAHTPNADSLLKKYSLRTFSYPYEETVGVIESMLLHEFGAYSTRVLTDADGRYLIEEGLYEDEESAKQRLSHLIASGFEFPLFVEARDADTMPVYRNH
jgi:hypothetical protein